MKSKPRRVPPSWPKWPQQCLHHHWRDGKQCKNRAAPGSNSCRRHGCGAERRERAWKRYLLWCLLPESIKLTHDQSPLTEDFLEIAAEAMAHTILKADDRMSGRSRLEAALVMLQISSVRTHPDPALLLTHLSREDAEAAVGILRLNDLIK